MSAFEKKYFEAEPKRLPSNNSVRPLECWNLDEIRLYITGLYGRIEHYKSRFNEVPGAADLLSRYSSRPYLLLSRDVIRNY